MKITTFILLACCGLSGPAISAAATPAAPARLQLWVTDSLGMGNGDKCAILGRSGLADAPALPTTRPTVTEKDVVAWKAGNASWTLDPARFAGIEAGLKLQDHCFVLAIDGRMISAGLVLSSHSARLTGFPTLSVSNRGERLELQLASGNHGRYARPIHVELLDAVLGSIAAPSTETPAVKVPSASPG